MGIHNRDYIRDDEYSSFEPGGYGGKPVWSVCRWLITINVVVFLFQIFTKPEGPLGVSPVTYWLGLLPEGVIHGQIWRLLTYAFCHGMGILHILFNMLFLYWFGRILEEMYGKKEFLTFYLVSAIFSGITFLVVAFMTHDPSPAIGASGAIMAIIMLFALHFPRQKVYLYFLFPIEIRWLVLAYVIFDSLPILNALAGRNLHDGVAHSAHLGGLLIGFLYYKFQWRFSNMLPGSFQLPKMKNRHQRGFKVYQPNEKDDELEKSVDEILAKISREGEASLTNKERKILKKASEKYKNK